MKKVLALLLVVMMMACVALAEETTEKLPEINFRGATLGATLGEVKEILECNVRNGNRYTIYTVNELLKNDLIWITMGDKDEKAANVYLADEEMFVDDVAGYSPIQSFAFFCASCRKWSAC